MSLNNPKIPPVMWPITHNVDMQITPHPVWTELNVYIQALKTTRMTMIRLAEVIIALYLMSCIYWHKFVMCRIYYTSDLNVYIHALKKKKWWKGFWSISIEPHSLTQVYSVIDLNLFKKTAELLGLNNE